MLKLITSLLFIIWKLPTNVFGHITGFLFSGFKGPQRLGNVYLYCGTVKVPGFRGAIVFGDCILYWKGFFDGLQGEIVLAHELAHVPQHKWLGPLYLPCHFASQMISAITSYMTCREISYHDYNLLENFYISLSADAYLFLTKLHCRGEALSEQEKIYMLRRGQGALLDHDSLLIYLESLGIRDFNKNEP